MKLSDIILLLVDPVLCGVAKRVYGRESGSKRLAVAVAMISGADGTVQDNLVGGVGLGCTSSTTSDLDG